MPNSERGGSPEQHAKAGEQSHKNTSGSGSKEAMSRSEWLRPRRNALYLRNRLKNEKSFVSPDDRSAALTKCRNLKMSQSAQAYVRAIR
jgi:hypothetical protein